MNDIFKIAIFLLTPLYMLAHSLVLGIYNNNDGTLSIVGEFNTGESAAGALVKLQALHSGEILFQQRLTDDELVVEIPKIPYKVVLDGGDGHIDEKIGVAPPSGFEKLEVKENPKPHTQKHDTPNRMSIKISSSLAVNVSIIFGFILLFATMFISMKNTNKLLEEIKKSKK